MPEVHEEPVAIALCRAVNMWPEVTEDKDDFLDKAISKFDSLTEVQYNQVPQPLRQWAENAITAKLNGNPFGECPGFDDVFDVEDRTPLFADGPEVEESEEPQKGKKGRKKVARGVKADKEKKDKSSTARTSRPMSDGKTSKIMDEIFANPKISVEQIRENLMKKHGLETQKTSTTVVRSFYRHSVKHLQSKGALKSPIEF